MEEAFSHEKETKLLSVIGHTIFHIHHIALDPFPVAGGSSTCAHAIRFSLQSSSHRRGTHSIPFSALLRESVSCGSTIHQACHRPFHKHGTHRGVSPRLADEKSYESATLPSSRNAVDIGRIRMAFDSPANGSVCDFLRSVDESPCSHTRHICERDVSGVILARHDDELT